MWWAILKYVSVTVVSILCGMVFTTSVNAWPLNVPPDFKSSDVKVSHPHPCPGKYGTISISKERPIKACIMGEDTQIASYFPAQGGVAYAISFPFENEFYRLDVCQGIWGCVYVEKNDTFAGVIGVYNHFVSNLITSIQAGVVHYSLNEHSSFFSVSQFGGRQFIPETVAISENGKWVALELKSYGFFRINTETSETRRIIAPGIRYGYAADPQVEMAISNDGNTLMVIGTRMGLSIVAINETCGDKPNEFMHTYYIGAVTNCSYVPTPTNMYIPSFAHATRPKISNNNALVSFDVFSNTVAARHVTLFSNNNIHHDKPHYLALGDSFTSGEGEVDDSFYSGGASNNCHVSTRSYPFLLAISWKVLGRSAACSGATMHSARGQFLKPEQPSQLAELESLAPQIATIGIGGNDAGLIGKLKDCLGLDLCKWAGTAEGRRNTALEIKNLYPSLKEFYVDVKTRTLGPVIVVGYPRIISAQPNCLSAIGVMLNQAERRFMNESVQYLNKVIQAAAIDSGVPYADIEDTMRGGELCASFESPLINAIRAGGEYPTISAFPSIKIIGSESFHPKPEGHVKVAVKILQSFSNFSTINTYMNNGAPTPVPLPGSYWDAEVDSPRLQQARPFLDKLTVQKKDLFEIFFPAFSFKPSTNIILELHSVVKNLGTVQSGEDGSLKATISSESFEPGFHSVHALGKNYTGNDIDIYDFLTVNAEAVANTTTGSVSTGTSNNSTQPKSPTKPLQVGNSTTFDILGASVVSGSSLDAMAGSAHKDTLAAKQLETIRGFHYKRVFVIAIIIGLTALAVSLYVYNRQKRSRNPS
jgi:lysophospholipase L1-like esterase